MTTRADHADALGVPPDAAPAAARAAFLRGLPGEGFAPPEDWAAAVNALAGAALPVPADGSGDLADEFRGFVARFWEMTPFERQARWEGLADRAKNTPFDGRLRHLAGGLALPPGGGAVEDPDAAALAARVREWFLLPPRERAVRRATWTAEHADEPGRWATAARKLRDAAPAVADLNAPFLARLRLNEPLPAVVLAGEPTRVPRADFAFPRTAPVPAPQGNEWGGRAAGFLILFGILAVLRLLMAGLSSSSSSPPRYNYTPPMREFTLPTMPDRTRFSRPQPDPWVFDSTTAQEMFTAEEVARFQDYGLKPVGPPPSDYGFWKEMGSPDGRAKPRPRPPATSR